MKMSQVKKFLSLFEFSIPKVRNVQNMKKSTYENANTLIWLELEIARETVMEGNFAEDVPWVFCDVATTSDHNSHMDRQLQNGAG